LTLLPAVEFYCRFQRPALVLLILQFVMLALRIRLSRITSDRALVIATFVFAVLGLIFNIMLLAKAHCRCSLGISCEAFCAQSASRSSDLERFASHKHLAS